MVNPSRSDYDSPWKEALTLYFEPFMAFCFPRIHSEINWSRGYETLDTELQEVVRDAETGRRLADKLVKVWRQSGKETLILVHIEIQGQVDIDFAKRMSIYNNRLFDRYDREVVSLAVLGDERKAWRPTSYGYARWDFKKRLRFPMVKLLDYQTQWSTLEQSTNPFAAIIMAHLKAKETTGKPRKRLESKLSLVRSLYERGYTREQILELFRLIDWMMVLPPDQERNFKVELQRYQEENRMPYITSIERLAKEEGKQEGKEEGRQEGRQEGSLETSREAVIAVLETRFGAIASDLREFLNQIQDLPRLKQLLRQSITLASVEEFERFLMSGSTES